MKKVNKTNQVQDEIGLPLSDFAAALNTTTTSNTASVSIVTELTMTTTPHQTDEGKSTLMEVWALYEILLWQKDYSYCHIGTIV